MHMIVASASWQVVPKAANALSDCEVAHRWITLKRDQLWVVHSLNPRRDLKAGDLRLRLISHAEDPSTLRPEINRDRKKFRSELEKAVFLGHPLTV